MAAAGFGREVAGAEGVAAHFLLTASIAPELAAEALLDISAICWAAGLGAAEGVAVDVEAQLWSAGKRCCGQNCCLQC